MIWSHGWKFKFFVSIDRYLSEQFPTCMRLYLKKWWNNIGVYDLIMNDLRNRLVWVKMFVRLGRCLGGRDDSILVYRRRILPVELTNLNLKLSSTDIIYFVYSAMYTLRVIVYMCSHVQKRWLVLFQHSCIIFTCTGRSACERVRVSFYQTSVCVEFVRATTNNCHVQDKYTTFLSPPIM